MVHRPGEGSGPAAAEALRVHGHRLIDRMADYLASIEARAVSTAKGPAELRREFEEPLPVAGRPADEVWDDVWERVVGDATPPAHPMYMGHQVAPPLPHAALADALASMLNQSVAVWEMSPTGTVIEERVIRWLAELVGFPAGSTGTLVSGGSAANLTALLAAREARFPGCWTAGIAGTPGAERGVLVTAEHAHYSVERTAGMMGFGRDAVVAVAEHDGRMDPASLAKTLRTLRAGGRIPFAVAATAGSTGTGHFDPLTAIADVCSEEGVWLHVDAAHGASFALSATHRHRLAGIERADSLSWDPHKMLWMPISAGAVLVRDGRHLEGAFRQSAPYLFHPRPGEEASPDAGRMTLQCSRRFDALKLWVALQHHGAGHFGGLLDATVERTASLHRLLDDAADFEPLHLPDGNILCFRHLPAGVRALHDDRIDAFQAELRARYNASGRGWITATVLGGRRALRVTLINPATTDMHLHAMLAALREIGREISLH
jgi:L-2,4-diaminobutyrate decarboxylase